MLVEMFHTLVIANITPVTCGPFLASLLFSSLLFRERHTRRRSEAVFGDVQYSPVQAEVMQG